MSAVATKFEVGNTVRHAAHGLGVIQRIFAEDRAFIKFIAPTADGDTEDVVLLEDLELFEDNPTSSKPAPTSAASSKPNPTSIGPMPKTPLKGKAPFLPGWQNSATTDSVQLSAQAQIPGVTGFGGVAKAEIGGYWALETDSPDVAKRYKADTGENLPNDGLMTGSKQGGHRWFKQTPESIAMGNIAQNDVIGGDFSARVHNEQCVLPGSLHPSGIYYELVNDAEPKEAPAKLIAWLIKQKKPAVSSQSTSSSEKTLVVRGGRNSHLCHRAGVLRRAGLEQEEIESVLLRENETDLAEPLDDKEVLVIARSVSRYEKGPLGATVTIGGAEPGAGVNAPQTSAETNAEVAVKTKNIHIAYSEDVFYGLAGQIIKKLQPETESHPVGNLLELLATFGNIVGPTAHYMIEDTRHYTNINVVKVGKSSKSRKGTGKARIERIASQLDSTWFTRCNTSGIGSGEAVIWQVRDPVMGPFKDKKTGEVTMVQIDPGETDKRLYISEGEFSGVLAVSGRKDSILSTVIRNAWDHKTIRNTVKGSPAVCQNPHISISADITRDELLNLLDDADKFNGFGNRFLWCFVDRQGLKPHGGEDIDWSKEIIKLYEAVEFTKKQSRIFMDRNAREMWNRIYEELSEDVDAGVVGAVTGRGEAQVIRLALIFAMLDLSDHIRVEHLKAARALWQYAEDSARIIFGGVLKTHQRILDFIKEGPKTVREIQDVLFTKHRKVSEIQADLNTLSAIGRVYTKTDETGVERYYSVGS
jgi:hypothetical protein